MSPELARQILTVTSATAICQYDVLQSLWSGYGEIIRVKLEGSDRKSVVVKNIKYPKPESHPRGWQSDFAHQRKLKSYQVETYWYANYANKGSSECKIPSFIWCNDSKQGAALIIEDLTPNYPNKPGQINLDHVKVCLSWLANFHAHNFQVLNTQTHIGGGAVDNLWPIGTYWHLETRPDEFKAMTDKSLKSAASAIDKKLKTATLKTIIHGDAKLDNFCFSADFESVAAVDFQYIGYGVGVKDVAYFFSSCLSSEDCFSYETELLDHYFEILKYALVDKLNEQQKNLLVQEWRSLYPFAWADFQRFLNGWSPDHWKLNAYSQHQTQLAINQIT